MKFLLKVAPVFPVCLLVLYICIYPEFELRQTPKGAANPTVAFHDFDEVSYLSFAESLRVGAPRKNNPYRRDLDVGNESLFSIQFI
ncbi:MAG: hypothetical protein ACK5NT_09745, partial [Pyrinomonadaceae bacterium]